MLTNLFRYPTGYFKYDLNAGIVVFLVAIPLCLGVALASGAPLFSGLISGVVGGIIVGSISTSQASVSGPAAGMIAIVLMTISQLGSYESFLLALFLAGLLQIMIGALKAGFIANYIPSNVIQGLLCAIGILIIIKQIPCAFTYTDDNAHLLQEFRGIAETLTLTQLYDIRYHINVGATLISLFSLGLLFFFDKTKQPILKKIPCPILVVLVGVIVNEIFINYFPFLTQLNKELVNIPMSHSVASFFNQFMHPNWNAIHQSKTFMYAFIIAAVASLETLLNIEAIDKINKAVRHISRNRELIAQGVGNTIAGLTGGIPITSVIVRSSVNVQSGAKSKLATIIHGILILIVCIFVPSWINMIPLASLAAILIYVGFKLIKSTITFEMFQQGLSRVIPFIITVLAILSFDLLSGVLIGLCCSLFFILRDHTTIQMDIVDEKLTIGNNKRILLPQQMTFLSKPALLSELNKVQPKTNLTIDARYTKYIDKDILEVLKSYQKTQAPRKKIALNLLGFKNYYEIDDHIDFDPVTTYDAQATITPTEVIDLLREGNKRFMSDTRIHRNMLVDVKATSQQQHPIAIVLGCIDSRVPIETIFDMGVGDVFVVRIAGNIVNDDILASMEFACKVAGAKLILVLGHTYCGAINAACKGDTYGGCLDDLLNKIQPAIESQRVRGSCINDNQEFIREVTEINIMHALHAIYHKSTVLKQLIQQGHIGLIGALYDVRTGEVGFHESLYDNHSHHADKGYIFDTY